MAENHTDADSEDHNFSTFSDADPDDVEYLFAQTSTGISVGPEGTITLTGVSSTTLFFSDRPYRVTGHLPTGEFVSSWGAGDDSFAEDPPNAVLSLFEDEVVNDVVVVLSNPVLSGSDLSYAVEVTEGELAATTGPTSLFIDRLGRPLTPMSIAGVGRRHRRRGRRRARRRFR